MALLFQDTFTDTTGTALQSHAPNVGGSWSLISSPSNLEIKASNDVGPATTITDTKCLYLASVIPGDADYNVKARISLASTNIARRCGVTGRCTDENNGYFVFHTQNNWTLFKFVSGTYTLLSNVTSPAPAVDDVFELDMVGTTIRMIVNSSQIASVTDSGITVVGQGGIAGGAFIATTNDWGSTQPFIDDFEINGTAPPAEPAYTQTAFRLYNDDGTGLGPPP